MPVITHRPCSGRTRWVLQLLVVVLKAKRACLPGCLLKLAESVPRKGVRAGLSPRTGPVPGVGLRGHRERQQQISQPWCAPAGGMGCHSREAFSLSIPASLLVLLGVEASGMGSTCTTAGAEAAAPSPISLGSCASSPSPKSYFYTVL